MVDELPDKSNIISIFGWEFDITNVLGMDLSNLYKKKIIIKKGYPIEFSIFSIFPILYIAPQSLLFGSSLIEESRTCTS